MSSPTSVYGCRRLADLPPADGLRLVEAFSKQLSADGSDLAAALAAVVPGLADGVELIDAGTSHRHGVCDPHGAMLERAVGPSSRLRFFRSAARGPFAEVTEQTASLVAALAHGHLEAAACRKQLADEIESQDELVSTLSHEIRTPLNVVLGWVEMLRMGTLDAERSAKALAVIDRNARIQARLVNDLLDASRIASGRLQLDRANWPIANVVREHVESLIPAAEIAEVALHLDIRCPSDLELWVDAERLGQMLGNLIGNAIKFTPAQGEVWVRLMEDGAGVVIEIEDTGIGMDQDTLARIYERFWQAPAVSHSGLGLGLFLTRHLAELHGGELKAHSDGLERGSTITVRLPRRTG